MDEEVSRHRTVVVVAGVEGYDTHQEEVLDVRHNVVETCHDTDPTQVLVFWEEVQDPSILKNEFRSQTLNRPIFFSLGMMFFQFRSLENHFFV